MDPYLIVHPLTAEEKKSKTQAKEAVGAMIQNNPNLAKSPTETVKDLAANGEESDYEDDLPF